MLNHVQLQKCIEACWNCRHACQKTLFGHCLPIGNVHMDEIHVKLMTDCIEICQLTADFMTRQSDFHAALCEVCADICEACAKSCERVGDEAMMRCGEACRACAQSCRTMGEQSQAA